MRKAFEILDKYLTGEPELTDGQYHQIKLAMEEYASQSGWIDEGIKYLRDLYSEVTDLERDKKQMERSFIIGIKKYLNHCHPNPNNHDTY